MEELLSSLSIKSINLQFGQEVEGKVVSLNDKEIVLDLGTKSEGILPSKELPKPLKVGDTLKVFVVQPENESGQVTVGMQKPVIEKTSRFDRGFRDKNQDWAKFIQAKNQNSKLSGTVIEVNKGGLILEVDGTRGFLPGSQIGIDALGKTTKSRDITGQELVVTVIEIDSNNNRLIFSQKGQANEELQTKLKVIKQGSKVKGQVLAIYPFGVLVGFEDKIGVVFPQDASWERVEDLATTFQTGIEVEAIVVGIEPEYGRINLSTKALEEDPYKKIAEKFQTDDVVSAVVAAVVPAGASFTLQDGVEGFMPSGKMGGTNYEVGQKIQVLVDSVDINKRKVIVAPFITSTTGLIYK